MPDAGRTREWSFCCVVVSLELDVLLGLTPKLGGSDLHMHMFLRLKVFPIRKADACSSLESLRQGPLRPVHFGFISFSIFGAQSGAAHEILRNWAHLLQYDCGTGSLKGKCRYSCKQKNLENDISYSIMRPKTILPYYDS